MIKVNGIKSCDTCKKALKWLVAEGIAHSFRDVREDGVTLEEVTQWGDAVGWDKLVNRSSTTWRGLTDAEKAAAMDKGAAKLLVKNPTLIKRPVFETGGAILIGFKADQQAALKAT